MFNYLYFSLSKLIITEVESALALAGVSSVNFNRTGTVITNIVLRTNASKATTAGVLLTEDEMSLVNGYSGLPAKVKDKLIVINNAEELKKFIEDEHDLSLSQKVGLPEIEESPSEVEVVAPSIESVSSYTQPSEEQGISTSNNVINDSVSKEPVSLGSVTTSETLEALDGLERLTYDRVFEERNYLLEEVGRLKLELKKAELNGGSPEKVSELESSLKEVKGQLATSQDLVSKLRESNRLLSTNLEDVKNDYNDMQLTLKAQSDKILNLEASLVGGSFAEALPRIEVPRLVQFFASASSLSLAVSYRHILSNYPNAVIVDLCRESLMDTLVHLKNKVRLTKWLLEGMDVRAVYVPFEEMELGVSSDVSIVSSPNTVLSDDLFTQVDWNVKLKDLSRLDRPIVVFLGIEDANGVSEFIDRLNTSVKILRADNNFDSRAFSRIKYKHDESVEEVIV